MSCDLALLASLSERRRPKSEGLWAVCHDLAMLPDLLAALLPKRDQSYKVVHCMLSSMTLRASPDSIRVFLDLYYQKKQNERGFGE